VKNHFPLGEDPRVLKEVGVLQKPRWLITFLSWNTQCNHSIEPCSFQKCESPTFKLAASLNNAMSHNPFLSYLLLPIWWLFVLRELLRRDWDMAHVINFQSIVPSVFAGKIKHKPVVYEIEDTWFDQMNLPRYVRSIFLSVDKFFMRESSAVVLIDEQQRNEFGRIPNRNVVVIYDSAIDINQRDSCRSNKDAFTLFYAGEITKHRRLNLDRLIEAVKGIDGVKVTFAGKGSIDQIQKWAVNMPAKVEFVGRVPYHEMLQRTMNSDLLFVLRDETLPLHKYICGSKIFEAMMCAKPILVGKGTSTAAKVKETKCGIVVDVQNIEEIRNAITTLKESRSLCNELGQNGRKAYNNIYGWEIMKQRLLRLYSEILGGRDYES
jgi:glycosyltransferase involved in cell wall biosynthesis